MKKSFIFGLLTALVVSTTIFTGCDKKEGATEEKVEKAKVVDEATIRKCGEEVEMSLSTWGDYRDASKKCIKIFEELEKRRNSGGLMRLNF